MKNQTEQFVQNEGDEWFFSNLDKLDHLFTISQKISFDIVRCTLEVEDKILEIGCSTGRNLHELKILKGVECYGIDPSAKAISYGKNKYSNINLKQGTANKLSYPNNYFNVVWFGFCMYLFDRSDLMKSVSEADRVLKDDGYLIITDFDPPFPIKKKYKDKKNTFSYKTDYSQFFLSNPSYKQVGKKSYSHSTNYFHENINERIATWLLKKNCLNAYLFMD